MQEEKKQEYFKTAKILVKIEENSRNGKSEFEDLYGLMHREDFIIQVVTKISKNKGIDTKGVDGKGYDGFGIENVTELSRELKEGKYMPSPSRRVYIPKPGKKKKRPLGIPTLKDKIVQGMVNEILTAIYEPVFEKRDGNANFGFRRRKGVRQAIEKIEQKGMAMKWCIEGDIEGAYDNVNHGKMINILSEKIKDKKFTKLIKNMLKSGIMERGTTTESEMGTPQGGIVSPTLFNIYMSELDKYIKRKIIIS